MWTKNTPGDIHDTHTFSRDCRQSRPWQDADLPAAVRDCSGNLIGSAFDFDEVWGDRRLHRLFQVPAELGGLGGRAVYLDTEGDFCGERMAEVGEAAKRDVLAALRTQARNAFEGHRFTDAVFYKRIQVRVSSAVQARDLINSSAKSVYIFVCFFCPTLVQFRS